MDLQVITPATSNNDKLLVGDGTPTKGKKAHECQSVTEHWPVGEEKIISDVL